MSTCPFCNLDPTPDAPTPNPPAPTPGNGKPPITLLRRMWRTTRWLPPTLLLVFMPKCPMCIAAYIALFTGIGITASAARWIYLLIPIFCFASLAYLVSRYCLGRFDLIQFFSRKH